MGKRAKPEEVIAKLCEIEIRLARGETAAARAVDVTDQSYYRWRKEYGGLQSRPEIRLDMSQGLIAGAYLPSGI